MKTKPLVCVTENSFSYFSTKTYVADTQKNRLIETVLLSTQNICQKLWVRKYLQFYAENFCLSTSKPVYEYSSSNFNKKPFQPAYEKREICCLSGPKKVHAQYSSTAMST